jgi:hypothetical protein
MEEAGLDKHSIKPHGYEPLGSASGSGEYPDLFRIKAFLPDHVNNKGPGFEAYVVFHNRGSIAFGGAHANRELLGLD